MQNAVLVQGVIRSAETEVTFVLTFSYLKNSWSGGKKKNSLPLVQTDFPSVIDYFYGSMSIEMAFT